VSRPHRKRSSVGDAAGRAALYPARLAARAWRGRLESAAEDVLSAPEVARTFDHALAGPLPEEFARSLVRHRVLERIIGELAASGELERLLKEALESQRTVELTDRILASDEMQRALESVASSPEVRRAITRQSAGLAEELVGGVRHATTAIDERVQVRPRPMPRTIYAGVGSRGVALAIDALLVLLIFTTASALVALIASLAGGIRPHWIGGTLLGSGWLLVVGSYFVLFWSVAGQTPGMRLMRLRVRRDRAGRLSIFRAFVRMIGLLLAIIPLFIGFVPALFDARRRALPDYLAGTVVVYEDPPPLEVRH
jgi:uncharacterized RDD family membrane protein YckC